MSARRLMPRASRQEHPPAERKLRRLDQAMAEIARMSDAGRTEDPEQLLQDVHERAVSELHSMRRAA